MGGRGRSLPCGCCDGPAASLRAAALLEAERSHQRHLIAQLDEELLDETLRREELELDNKILRLRVGGLNDIIDRDRKRARERVEELERSNIRQRVERLDEILE